MRAVAEQMGKTAVVVRDAPGFASSRLGIALGMEAIRMVGEQVASPADGRRVDEGMVAASTDDRLTQRTGDR